MLTIQLYKNGDGHIGTIYNPISSGSYDDYGITKPEVSIHSHPNVVPTIIKELDSMGYMPDINNISGDMAKVRSGQAPFYNYVYLPMSGHLYNVESVKPRFIRNIKNYKDFYFGTLNNQ